MKITCEIVKDLLPLYHDNVCSAQSKALVEEHLAQCEECRMLLSEIQKAVERPALTKDEAKPIRALKFAWNKEKKKAVFKGALIALLICAVLCFGWFELTQNKFVPVSAKSFEVSQVCMLSDGRIAYNFAYKDIYVDTFKNSVDENGVRYITPVKAIIDLSAQQGTKEANALIKQMNNSKFPASFESAGFSHGDWSMTVDLNSLDLHENAKGYGTPVTAVYIGTKNDSVLIWEKGMELPPADEHTEELFNVKQK